MREERLAAEAYDRWLASASLTPRGLAALVGTAALLPGLGHLVNAEAFRIASALRLTPTDRVVEVGSGAGTLLRSLQTRVGFQTPPLGIESSARALRLARGLTRRGAVAFARGFATRLPIADRSVDVILCGHRTHRLPDVALRAFYIEACRALRPGGRLLLWDHAPVTGAAGRLNRWLLTRGVRECHLRDYAEYAHLATQSGFGSIERFDLSLFLLPPVRRVAVLLTRRGTPDEVEPFVDDVGADGGRDKIPDRLSGGDPLPEV